jgi:hypothetical protein
MFVPRRMAVSKFRHSKVYVFERWRAPKLRALGLRSSAPPAVRCSHGSQRLREIFPYPETLITGVFAPTGTADRVRWHINNAGNGVRDRSRPTILGGCTLTEDCAASHWQRRRVHNARVYAATSAFR